jgi:hypothetical protein
MKFTLAGLLLLTSVSAAPAASQDRYPRQARQGIPPGHLPPPGECRVWYDGRPPGQQPPPTDCQEAERIASRSRAARVIYGDERHRREEERYRRDDVYSDRGRTGRAVPRPRDPSDIPGARPRSGVEGYNGRYGDDHPAVEQGYRDGIEKGREDVSKNRRYEPNRHSWYRSATRGYDRRLGSRDEYMNRYREAFTAGYADGFDRFR